MPKRCMYVLAPFSFKCLDCYHAVPSLRSARNNHFVFRYAFDVSLLPSERCRLRGACMPRAAVRAVGHRARCSAGTWSHQLAVFIAHENKKFVSVSMHACYRSVCWACVPQALGRARLRRGDLPAWCSTRRICQNVMAERQPSQGSGR